MHKQIPPTAALMLSVALVFAGGRMLDQPPEFVMPDADEYVIADDPFASVEPAPPVAAEPAETGGPKTSGSAVLLAPPPADVAPTGQFSPDPAAAAPAEALAVSRQVAPAGIAPTESGDQALEREAPRDPLSPLSLALPPPPAPKNPWAGKPLFRPLATGSAVFESGGHTISIDGVESIGPEQTCSHAGAEWPCGVRARAAFRAWLRGRALVCQLPEGQDEAAMRGKCRLAKQDVGEWLVENGWAMAVPGGPYAQAGEKARAEGRGVFGPPPDTLEVGEVPDMPAGLLHSTDLSIMGEDDADLPQAGPLEPADPRMAFPPAPPAP